MDESIADIYYNELLVGKNRVATLVNFYNAVFELDDVSKKTFGRIGKLGKLYGAQIVFESILDSASADASRDIFPLIGYYCKKNFNKKQNPSAAVEFDLTLVDKKLEELEKEGLRYVNIEDL
jgi:hypothetical protein